MNSKFELEQDKSETITVLLLFCSNSNFEFTRCYFSESVLFYITLLNHESLIAPRYCGLSLFQKLNNGQVASTTTSVDGRISQEKQQ